MTPDQVIGPLRALVPALVAYLVGRGLIPAGAAADVVALILALGAAGWSWYSNSRAAQIASVAAMQGTSVRSDGQVIAVLDPSLIKAARESATDASGKYPAVP